MSWGAMIRSLLQNKTNFEFTPAPFCSTIIKYKPSQMGWVPAQFLWQSLILQDENILLAFFIFYFFSKKVFAGFCLCEYGVNQKLTVSKNDSRKKGTKSPHSLSVVYSMQNNPSKQQIKNTYSRGFVFPRQQHVLAIWFQIVVSDELKFSCVV